LKSTFLNRTGWIFSSLVLISWVGCWPARACGPFFPNTLLAAGSAALLDAPTATFLAELEAMAVTPSHFLALPAELGFAEQTTSSEKVDLERALRSLGKKPAEAAPIVKAVESARDQLRDWLDSIDHLDETPESHVPNSLASPPFPTLDLPSDLPAEFADYLEGAWCWHNPAVKDKSNARHAWKRLLARPPGERKYKSTWAAYMLGKSFEKENADQAMAWYQKVRELAAKPRNFTDTAGLAAASLGLEARLLLRRHDYAGAINLYLDQLATGDQTAPNSLRFAAKQALQSGPAQLAALAKNPSIQPVITAYVISHRVEWASEDDGESKERGGFAIRWLEAVEVAGIKEVASAERFALAAYQANALDLAERWAKRSAAKPVSQLVQAKLLLRKGKVVPAAAILSRLTALFPPDEPLATNAAPASLFDRLLYHDSDAARQRTRGELGVLRLSRRDYVQALDALLRSGYERDADYVAERVLSVDELKTYVDRNWPPGSSIDNAMVASMDPSENDSAAAPNIRKEIRHLLARRLTRTMRGDEAGDYYPTELRESWRELVQSLRAGRDDSLDARARAEALFSAAWIARTNGLELLGTAVEPDWFIYGGNFEMDPLLGERRPLQTQVAPASDDELRRAARNAADPDQRFHYRYQAAFLGWEAASLLPDNDDLTARILWQSGVWLKHRDPQTADLFYKALVKRNRRTVLGSAADAQRWFPVLTADGSILSPKPRPASLAAPAAMDQPTESSQAPTSPAEEVEERPE